MLAQRDALDQRIAEGLYPGTAADAAGGSGDAQAMFYLLRAPWQTDEIAHDGKLLNQGQSGGVGAEQDCHPANQRSFRS